MEKVKLNIELNGQEIKPVFGGRKIRLLYHVSFEVNGEVNSWEVFASIRGLNEFTPEIDFEDVAGRLGGAYPMEDEDLIYLLDEATTCQLAGYEEVEL